MSANGQTPALTGGIASLVPSATEMLAALGLLDRVVAVTHECDHPPEAASKPHLTRTVIPDGLTSAEIDAEVKRVTGEGRALYELDEELLERLGPGLVVTQAVCEVCAVAYDDVQAVAARLPSRPEVISLDPETLEDVLADVGRLGEAAGVAEDARALERSLRDRLDRVREAVAGAERPRVLGLEWLEPPFAGGHWIPEMIEIAGGADPVAKPGDRSRELSWEELAAAGPDAVVVMPCGWDERRAVQEAGEHRERLDSLGASRMWAVDAAASYSRPGPRLVDGTELLAHLLHPDRVEAPAGVAFERL